MREVLSERSPGEPPSPNWHCGNFEMLARLPRAWRLSSEVSRLELAVAG